MPLILLLALPAHGQQEAEEAGGTPEWTVTAPRDACGTGTNAGAATNALPPLTRKTRLDAYEYALFGWQRMVASAAWAGVEQMQRWPREWPQGLGGYTQRFADSWGGNAVQETVAYGFSSILHEDPRYLALHRGSVWHRVVWTLRWTVLIRTDSGGVHPNFPLIVGAYASEFAANSWYPAPDNDPKSALRRGSYGLLGDFAFNLWREFGPSWRPRVGGQKPQKRKKPPSRLQPSAAPPDRVDSTKALPLCQLPLQ